MPHTVGLVSLGCPKNLVDSEVMLGMLAGGGRQAFTLTNDPAKAELLIVNTCGFIDKARRESVDAILDMARYKKEGRCRALVVTGCLVQAHAEELKADLPEVDAFLGSADYAGIREVALKLVAGRRGAGPLVRVGAPRWLYSGDTPRLLATPGYMAYLKVSEGCSHACGFCAIPALRGALRSRSVESCVDEAERLARRGVRELIVISQDTSAYGRDRWGKPRLRELLGALDAVEPLKWVRLHYLYPAGLDDALLEAWARSRRVAHYIDMPLQHADDAVLKAMRRPGTRDSNLRLLERMRRHLPDACVRSAFIVGHPGETDAAFKRLLAFIGEAGIDRAGFFAFSPEEGTPSAALKGQVPARERQARLKAAMAEAARVSRRLLARRLGSVLDVLVTGFEPAAPGRRGAAPRGVGRSEYDAPEIDGRVLFSPLPGAQAKPGDFVRVRIERNDDHDLFGIQVP